jgi:hypothetical protein
MKKEKSSFWSKIDLKNYWQLYLMILIVGFFLLVALGILDLTSVIDLLIKEKTG